MFLQQHDDEQVTIADLVKKNETAVWRKCLFSTVHEKEIDGSL